MKLEGGGVGEEGEDGGDSGLIATSFPLTTSPSLRVGQ